MLNTLNPLLSTVKAHTAPCPPKKQKQKQKQTVVSWKLHEESMNFKVGVRKISIEDVSSLNQ